VALNRAVAVGERDGPAAGLALIADITGLERFPLWHSARAELLRRLGRGIEASAAYRAALTLELPTAERRFLERRLSQLSPPARSPLD
jgi:predicted RNA polymerase sigma factor